MKKIAKICSKNKIKEELQYIKVTKSEIIATDSFRAVVLKNNGQDEGYYHYKTGEKKEIKFYPDINELKKRVERDNKIKLTLNREFLIDCLQALDKSHFDKIDILVSEYPEMPIYIKNDNGYALLAQINL